MRTAAVILAAGAATRFGSLKQVATLGDGTLLEAVIGTARASGLDPIIVVVPPTVHVPADVVAVENPAPELGMSRSLQLGLGAVPVDADAAVVMLGDQPTLATSAIAALLTARGARPIVAALARGLLAPPVLLEREAFRLADEVSGDRGLRDLLRDHPDLVNAVDVGEHAPDVDTPADLTRLQGAGESCPGCYAKFDVLPGAATHEYVGSSPGCWAAFGELAAREFGDPAYGAVHRHTVDVYMVQHPGQHERRQRQSVALHLIGLCHWLEHGMQAGQLNPITQSLASQKREWPWLQPPDAYDITVLDVLAATSPEQHRELVQAWAVSVWQAWSAHREIVRGWAADAMKARR